MSTALADILNRSRASLDAPVRDALTEGRILRSRNRDGEYAIVLAPDAKLIRTPKASPGSRISNIDHLVDERANWTIVVPGFTLTNVATNPGQDFDAPVFANSGERVGTIRVNDSPFGFSSTDQGRKQHQTVFFTALRAGDLFREAESDADGYVVLFRATSDATNAGRVTAQAIVDGSPRVFDLGPDYLAFKVV